MGKCEVRDITLKADFFDKQYRIVELEGYFDVNIRFSD